jgi:putative ABC transport system permease protein
MQLTCHSAENLLLAVLILGFGIGANTAIFSLINAVLLNPLPFPRADHLVQVFQSRTNNGLLDRSDWGGMDYPDYVDLLDGQQSFDGLAVQYWDYLDLGGQGMAERLTAIFTSPDLFKVTSLPFVLGRPFTDEEDKTGGPEVVVLSESLWKRRFNSDPNIIGKNITLSGESFQVIGVCPRQTEDVSTPSDDSVYLPVHISELFGGRPWLQKRDEHALLCFGRLKAGVGIARAQADLAVIQDNVVAQYADIDKGYQIHLIPLFSSTVATYSATVWLLGGAVGCLLLISCANVANLLFARALERRKEMAIRATLGASRLRLAGQLLSETAFLAFLGGLLGLAVARVSIGLIKVLSPDYLNRFQAVHLDTTALLFVFGVTVIVSLLSGLLPALSLSKTALRDEGGRAATVGPQRQRAQSLIVTGQVALACVLLIGTGLLVRSFQAIQSLPLGFDPHHILSANINPTSRKYSDMARIRNLFDTVLAKVRQLTGVIDAAMNQDQPFEWTFGDLKIPFHVPGQLAPQPGKEPTMCAQAISPNYFKTMQIPLLQGRDFNAGDRVDSRHVVIVDEAFAQRFFPDRDPIGKQVEDLGTWTSKGTWTIVGVVQNSRHNGPEHLLAPFQTYFPYSQRENLYRQFLLIRTAGDPTALISAVRQIVASVDPDVPVDRMMNLDDLIASRSATRRLGVLLVTLLSSVALLLSAVGLYGTLAYSVSLRKRELGVRIALGARASNISRLVIRQGLKLVCCGLIVGIGSALILVRFIDSILYGVSGSDPVSLGLAILVLGLAGLLACLLPALRATRINPITALRE